MLEKANQRALINTHMVFRCTSSKYADDFIKKGAIKFNTPEFWANYAIENCEGRGDRLEGTIAMYHQYDIKAMEELNEKYSIGNNLIKMPFGDRVYLKNKRSMELPCYCCYILDDSLFKIQYIKDTYRFVAKVSKTYFRDFMDNLSLQQVEKIPDDEKPAVIVISNFNEFKRRLYKKLLSIGLEENEIITSAVVYENFNEYGDTGWIDFGQKSPIELTIKSDRFIEQSEIRIIINTDKKDIKDFLKENTIEIEPMDDIASVYNGYLYDGIDIIIHPDKQKNVKIMSNE